VTLPEARRRVWTFRFVGGALVLGSLLFLALILVKDAYESLPSGLLFQPLGRSLRRAIDPILEASPLVALLWSLIPAVDHQSMYLVLMGSTIWTGIGMAIMGYANRLAGRIRRARETIEEERWRRSLGHVDLSRDVGVVSIQLESEERWYQRPVGLVWIGLIITIIGELAVVFAEHWLYP
jgi:hypothetical protein